MYQKSESDHESEKSRVSLVEPAAYEVFMDEQNIPIHRGLGCYDARQLPLAPWKRMGGKGTFVELDGQAGYYGMYVIEVPPGGVLNAERHLYEELFLVIEGHGSTEVWREGSSKKQTFEWQAWSYFGVPINVWHRLVNASSSPALVLAATSAPSVMNPFPNRNFIFDNPFEFWDRYDEREDYFKPREYELMEVTDPAALERKKRYETIDGGKSEWVVSRGNLIPDIAQCNVPLANTRAPGQGRVMLRGMTGSLFFPNFVAMYPSGRYSTAHSHEAGRVLVCVRGKGYSMTWPLGAGKRPWEAGKGHLVKRQDYIPGGLVTAAPAAGDWFHQHLSTGKDAMRVLAFRHPLKAVEGPGEEIELPNGTLYLGPGRHEVSYPEEDPQVRKDYQAALKKEGAKFTMPEAVYQPGSTEGLGMSGV